MIEGRARDTVEKIVRAISAGPGTDGESGT